MERSDEIFDDDDTLLEDWVYTVEERLVRIQARGAGVAPKHSSLHQAIGSGICE